MKKLNLKTFELSQNYQMFWDKLEKSNYFLESILDTLDEPTDGRLIQHLIASPVQDGGQWDMFCALVDKYGCVPKAIMPETFHSSNTGVMNMLITRKLREDALVLREAHKAGESADALRARKEGMLNEVYRMLCIALGEPPKTFTFEYRDEDKNYYRDENITPLEFVKKYVGHAMDDYVSIINAPTADKPYWKTYTVQYLGNVVGGRKVKYLNLAQRRIEEAGHRPTERRAARVVRLRRGPDAPARPGHYGHEDVRLRIAAQRAFWHEQGPAPGLCHQSDDARHGVSWASTSWMASPPVGRWKIAGAKRAAKRAII